VYRHFVDRDLLINENPLSVFAAEAIFVTSLAEAESASFVPGHPCIPDCRVISSCEKYILLAGFNII
jgi:hypothetical protein